MQQHIRAFAVLSMALILGAGCSRGARQQRVSEAPPPPPTVAASTTEAATPIPGHPPVTMSGVVAHFDPATGILTFEDGRTVKVTEKSKVLRPVETRTVRAGEPVIVRDALPVGVQSASTRPGSATARAGDGKRHRVGTVARVDQQNQHVWLTDGTAVRATPSTRMRMGTAGKTIVLAELRPGDELVIVMEKDGATPPKPDGATAASALPREVASATPVEASELMVFREAQAP
jgi:hypothetical protein